MAKNGTQVMNMTRVEDIYGYVFDFERNLDVLANKHWFERVWLLSYPIIALYLGFIYSLQWYMKSKPAMDLRRALFAWNLLLALFSILGTYRTWSYMVYFIRTYSFTDSICTYVLDDQAVVFCYWIYLFTLSKVLELGDTVFIVLRKHPLIFLHWYHHISVLYYVWYTVGLKEVATSARWFMSVNFAVHSLMYSYFSLKSLKIRVPKIVSMLITVCQISQMVVGVYVAVRTHSIKSGGGQCHMPESYPKASLFLYFTYFMLFLHFFIDAYINKTSIMKRIVLRKDD